jgi:hypothetical protein
MHESDKQELRRVILRVLQKDFHSLTAVQFESWAKQVLTKLDRVEQNTAQLAERLNALQARVDQLDGAAALTDDAQA